MKTITTEQVFSETTAVLTATELEILKDIAAGMAAKEIAAKRKRSDKTIEVHLHNIRKKTGINKMPLLIATLIRQKVID